MADNQVTDNQATDKEESDLRGLLFSIAYRMTGSVGEGEDLVQEAFFRLERARQSGVVVQSAKAYLAATTTRLAIDHLRSARARRESYVGPWLPEPIVGDQHESPEQMAELSESLSMAFLVLLESLSPVERAVFLLREVFGYRYADIALIVDRTEVNCRQVFTRARQHLHAHRARYEAPPGRNEALVRSFIAATRHGDLDQLVEILAADAAFYGDGGGQATAISEPIHGRDQIAPLLLWLFARTRAHGVRPEPALVNGGPGIVTRDGEGRIVGVLSMEVLDGVIHTLRSVVNPEKLGHLGPVSDFLRIQPPDDVRRPDMQAVEESPNKSTFRRAMDAANAHDETVLSEIFDEVFAPDVVIHHEVPPAATGPDSLKQVFVTLTRGFPDLHVRIDDLLEDGDKVVARQTVTGTNLGQLSGRPATGRSVSYDEIFIFRFAGGRVVETWGVVDVLSCLRQLGALQAPGV